MGSSLGLACFSIISLESLLGIFTNVFITWTISLNSFKYQKSLSDIDKIIVALSVSNICFDCVAFSNIFIFYFCPKVLLTSHLVPAIYVSITFIFTTSLWLTASLCFFYYVKIKNFTSGFLSQLKTRISSLVPWMIFMSVALSLFMSCLNIITFAVGKKLSEATPDVHSNNRSRVYVPSKSLFGINLYISSICSFIPILISVMTMASTAFSLHLHSQKMTKNKSSASNPRVNTYEDTSRVMIHLLIYYTVIYIVLFLFYFNIFDTYSVGFWLFLVIMCSYSATQSILISLATTKLKQSWMKFLHIRAESGEEDENREE